MLCKDDNPTSLYWTSALWPSQTKPVRQVIRANQVKPTTRNNVGENETRQAECLATSGNTKSNSEWLNSEEAFKPYIYEGVLTTPSLSVQGPVKILHDTGSNHSVVIRGAHLQLEKNLTGDSVILKEEENPIIGKETSSSQNVPEDSSESTEAKLTDIESSTFEVGQVTREKLVELQKRDTTLAELFFRRVASEGSRCPVISRPFGMRLQTSKTIFIQDMTDHSQQLPDIEVSRGTVDFQRSLSISFLSESELGSSLITPSHHENLVWTRSQQSEDFKFFMSSGKERGPSGRELRDWVQERMDVIQAERQAQERREAERQEREAERQEREAERQEQEAARREQEAERQAQERREEAERQEREAERQFLGGKVLIAYKALPPEEQENWDVVHQTIAKEYEITPERWRRRW
ncbi:inner centromere protein A-like [Macrobrachium rosenbergii]|uniref:inner centromere protein A-like n=1 Tax=Macrobrachium rosenbergii TaxID=79674 RepID=UPI0034D71CE6